MLMFCCLVEIRNKHFYFDSFLMVTSFIDALYIFGGYHFVLAYAYILLISLTNLCSKILRFQIAISAIIEMNVSLADQSSSIIVVVIVVAIAFIGELFFISKNGHFRCVSILRSVISITSIIVVISELFVIGVFYGFRIIFSNMSLMMVNVEDIESKKGRLIVNSVILVLWTAVIPLVTIFTLMTITAYFNKMLHSELDIYDVLLICSILSPIPVLLLYRIEEQYRTGCSITPLFKRNPDLWGPRLRSNRNEADKAERMIRKWW
ncbi:hypothetical protein DICVIV_13118 [Dictyocaulus viviparus]|uniref:Uncharacterized protein n=1 Tax=Dictyocaulus viviparus TaxID=29172 RepID=A0A0D8XER4_DICVI|nr:hypothetical protein DICVIV_13118 [Dictyocaulus viviparus]